MVYRFKVTYEDHEDVFRHIEIKSSQSFLELHTAIQQSIGFDNSKSATFYMSDDYWRKVQEISVENTGEEKGKKTKIKKSAAGKEEPQKKKTIADHIDDPHQRFVYIFDPEAEWTFLLELMKIVPADSSAVYPQCIKTAGNSPKQYKVSNLPPPPADEEDEPKKSISPLALDKDEQTPLVLEKDPLDEEAEGFIPLDEDGIEELASDDDKEPGDDSEEPEADDDAGEIDPQADETSD